jgi:hypothetical protein
VGSKAALTPDRQPCRTLQSLAFVVDESAATGAGEQGTWRGRNLLQEQAGIPETQWDGTADMGELNAETAVDI